MPFTLSHPAAVLPFAKWVEHPMWMLALVIGSLTPDIGYYTRTFNLATVAHSLPGSFLICVPTGLLLMAALLFFRSAILFLLPSAPRAILAPALQSPTQSRLRLIGSLAGWVWLGAFTHIVWDAFTHKSGWFAEKLAVLQSPILSWKGQPLPFYYLLQQGSTLIGLLVVLTVLVWRVLRISPVWEPGDRWRYLFWSSLVIVSLAGALPFSLKAASDVEGFLKFRTIVFQTAVYSGSVFALLLLAILVTVKTQAVKISLGR